MSQRSQPNSHCAAAATFLRTGDSINDHGRAHLQSPRRSGPISDRAARSQIERGREAGVGALRTSAVGAAAMRADLSGLDEPCGINHGAAPRIALRQSSDRSPAGTACADVRVSTVHAELHAREGTIAVSPTCAQCDATPPRGSVIPWPFRRRVARAHVGGRPRPLRARVGASKERPLQ
jgi:hypothetical protein